MGEELSTAVKQLQWQKHKDVFQEKIQNINKKVFNYNLSTPILRSQIVPYKPEKLIDKVLKNYDDLRSRGELPDRTSKTHTFVTPVTYSPDERISMKVVWKELKALFNSWQEMNFMKITDVFRCFWGSMYGLPFVVYMFVENWLDKGLMPNGPKPSGAPSINT